MPAISVQREPVFTVSMRLNETEMQDLWQSVGEAIGIVDNWRSDPSVLIHLRDNLKAALDAR